MTPTKTVFAFVIMPFSDEYDDCYRLAIKESAKNAKIKCERLDEQYFQGAMLDQIYGQIEKADVIIAELSEKNPNVFYELGYAHGLNKQCVLLTKNADSIPFDLKHKRHIVYGTKNSKLKEMLTNELLKIKNEIIASNSGLFDVSVKVERSDLVNTETMSKAELTIGLEIKNRTTKTTPEITSIYFYSGKEWNIEYAGKKCKPHKISEDNLKYRYLIPINPRKLGVEGSIDIEFGASRILASTYRKEEIKTKYDIHGTAMIRIETVSGNEDKKVDIVTTVEELPF